MVTILVQDTFTAADFTPLTSHAPDVDAAGGGWQVIPGLNGSLTIHNGFAVALGASNAQQFGCFIETGESDIKATWTVVLPNANVVYPSRFIFRYVDASNYLAVDAYPTGNAIFLLRVVGGAASVIPVSDYLPGTGVQGLPLLTPAGALLTAVTIIAEGTDITIQYGDEVLTYHGVTDHLTATKCGLLGAHRSAGPTSFDNLTIETVPARSYGDPVIWLKAGEGAYAIDGDLASDSEQVALWLDQSGRGHSAINHLQPERPYYDAGAGDGAPAIYFPRAASENLQFAVPVSKDGGLTLFMYLNVPPQVLDNHNDPMRLTTRPTSDPSDGGNDDDRFMWAYYDEEAGKARLRNMEDGSFVVDYLSNLTPDGQWHLVSWCWDFANGTVTIRIDKTTVHTQSSLPPPDADYAWGGIGSALGGAYAIECWIREFRVYGDAMSAGEMAVIENEIVPAPGQDLVEVTDEVVDVAEASVWELLTALIKAAAGAVGIVEAAARTRGLVRSLTETLGAVDALTRARAIIRAAADPLGLTETATRLRQHLRSISEAIESAEGVLRSLGWVRAPAEPVGVGEAGIRVKGLYRLIAEAIDAGEVAAALRILTRAAAGAVGIGETFASARSLVRILSEAVGPLEVVRRVIESLGALAKVIGEGVGLAESGTRIRSLIRTATETAAAVETAIRARSITRVLAELAGTGEDAAGIRGFVKVVGESLALAEAAAHVLFQFTVKIRSMFKGMFKGMRR